MMAHELVQLFPRMKEELMDSTMVRMKGIPREMHLDYHLEMKSGSRMVLQME